MRTVTGVSQVERIRCDLAAVLAEAMGVTGFPTIPASPTAGTVFVRPPTSGPYLDFREDETVTWGRPVLHLEAVVVVPSADYDRVHSWADEAQEALRSRLYSSSFEVGGHRRPTLVDVGPLGLLDAGAGLWAFELRFTPITLAEVGS